MYGAYLRLFALGLSPLWIDEAFSLASTKMPMTSESWLWLRSVLYHRLLDGFTALVGESEIALRLPSVVASLVGMLMVATICYRRFGRLSALVALIVLAFGYWHIAWARQAREYALLLAVFWIGMAIIDRHLFSAKLNSYKKIGKGLTISLAFTLIAALVHPFGLLLAPAVLFGLVLNTQRSDLLSLRAKLALLALLTLMSVMSAHYLAIPLEFKKVYWLFLKEQYWILGLSGLLGFSFATDSDTRMWLLWLSLICIVGFVVISVLVPLVNLRYLYFLTPIFAIGIAAIISGRFRYWRLGLVLAVLAVLFRFDALQLTPQKNYELESFSTKSGFRFYTPQPRFDLAYSYIRKRLKDKDLVTAYPAVSRYYRRIDDTLVLDAKITFGRSHSDKPYRSEYYTDVPFADGSSLLQLAKASSEVYVLIDQMARERIDLTNQIILNEHGELVRQWLKRPNSSLFLYKVTAQEPELAIPLDQ